MYKISVVTINYNDRNGLNKTILSVLQQSTKNFEYIVIDGKSTDGSKNLLDDYKDQISYFVSENDNGIYHAMNKGIKAATGEFIIFMNSGDVFYDETILAKILLELQNGDEIVYGDIMIKSAVSENTSVQVHPEKLTFRYFYERTICQQACIIKKSLFEKIFCFNEEYKIVSDWEFLIVAIFKKNISYRKVHHVLAIFDSSGVSTTENMRKIATQEREKSLEKYFPLYKDDYKKLTSYSSKRSQQLLEIQESKFFRKLVSILFTVILIFIPKKKLN
jgi:glycosyltransferase involved in cell wall biosynthesis